MYFRFDTDYKKILEILDDFARRFSDDKKGSELAEKLRTHIIENWQNCVLEKDYTRDGGSEIRGDFTYTCYEKVDLNKKHTLKDIIDYLINVRGLDWFNGRFENYKIDIYNGKIVEYKDEKLPDDIFDIQIERVKRYSSLGNKPEETITFYRKEMENEKTK